MKKKLRLMMTMLFLTLLGGMNTAWAETSTIDMSTGSNGTSLDGVVINTSFGTLTYGKGNGTTAPAFYDKGSAVRFYNGNTITLDAGSNTITKVELYNTESQVFGEQAFSVNGTYSLSNKVETWLGSTSELIITSSSKPRLTKIVVTYTTSGPIDPTVQLLQERVNVGETMQIDYPNDLGVSFSSTNNGVASVSPTGLVTGVSSGSATISAVWGGNNKYNSGRKDFDITVVENVVFVEVTNSNQLVAGNEYILVATEYEVAMGKPDANNSYRQKVNVTISNNEVITSDENISILTLGGNAGTWTFKNGAVYLAYSGNDNKLFTGTDPTQVACQWIITDDFQLQSKNVSERYLQYNSTSGQERFACYKGTQKKAILYVKKNSPIDDKIDPELAFTPTTVTAEVGGAFTAPTLSFAVEFDGTITYASSNPEVATVDASTGEVTIVAAGETIISATSEATGNFKAGSASYTLTVEAASHNVMFSANGATFSTTTAKEGANIEFPTENPTDEGDFKFIGWSTEDWTGEVDDRPTTLVTSATMGTEDMTIYAVYAIVTEGTGVRWKKMAASEVTEEGTYAIITSTEGSNAYYAFNGTITSGHGQTTPNYFTFDTDGYADSAPEGTCELIFEASGEGFTMRTEDLTANGNKPYLCASDASSGSLSWLSSGEYWSYINENWTYNKNFGGKYAYLRQFNNTLRTYGSNNGRPIEFAKKVGGITYSNYCTKINGFEKVTLSTDGYITYVTKNAIDWVQTLARNSQDGVDVHGYKVVDFSLDNGVSMVEYGVENLSTVASTDKMYQEPIIPAGTPIIIQGKQGDNYMVVADEENVTAPAGNLLRASDGIATTTDEVKLFVLQKIDQSGSGINNYTFYRLTKGRQIPVGKAYLSSEDMTLPNPGTPGVDPNNMPAANFIRILVQTDNDSLVSDDAGIIDGIGTVAQDSEDGQVIYNLNGVKVNNPSKGIYVKNGKKVIIK